MCVAKSITYNMDQLPNMNAGKKKRFFIYSNNIRLNLDQTFLFQISPKHLMQKIIVAVFFYLTSVQFIKKIATI